MTATADCPDHAHVQTGRSRRAVFGVIWSALNTVVPTLATTLIFILSSRLLTPDDFGVVALAASVVSIATGLAPASFADALVQRARISTAHMNAVFWLGLTTGLAYYAILVLSAPALAHWLDTPVIAALLPLLGLKVIFDLCGAVPGALIARSMRYHIFAIRTAIATLLSGAVCVAMLLLDYGLWALAVSQLVSSFVNLLAGFWACRWRPALRPRFTGLRDVARFGLFASGNRLLNIANLDHLAIGALGGTAMLGVFMLAHRLHMMVQDLIAGALSSVSYTVFSTLQSEHAKTAEAYYLILFASLACALPAFAGLALVAPDFTPMVLGAHWQPAIVPIQIICALGVIGAIASVDAALINGRGKPDWWFGFLIVEKLVGLVLICALYRFGLTAIMLGLLARGVLLTLPVTTALSLRLMARGPGRHLAALAAPGLACAAMAIVVLAVKGWSGEAAPWRTLLCQIGLGGVTYAAVLLPLSLGRLAILRDALRPQGKVAP